MSLSLSITGRGVCADQDDGAVKVDTLCKKVVLGNHTVRWNAAGISSGVYFLRLDAGSFSDVEKLILIN